MVRSLSTTWFRWSAVFLAAVVLDLACPFFLRAAAPTLTSIDPRGAERGQAVTLVVTGANLTSRTRLELPFKAAQNLIADAKPNPAQVRFQVTVDRSVPLGIYPVRVTNEEGISSLVLFSVDAFPGVNELEDNNTLEKAQRVVAPVVINGQCAGGDVDFFRFAARKGQRLVIETESARLGSGIIPQIRLTDAAGRFIAADDTQAVRGDCRLLFDVPADGDYVVEISDSLYRGTAPPHYRLKIAEYDVVEEVFPPGGRRGQTVDFTLRGGTLPKVLQIRRPLTDPASSGTMLLNLDGVVKTGMHSPCVALGDLPERVWIKAEAGDPRSLDVLPPITINSRLERKGDVDRFQFPVQAGQRYRIGVQAEALGSRLDGVLRVVDQAGNQLALVDDVDVPAAAPGQPALKNVDPSLDLVVPAGVSLLRVELRDQRHRGGINFVYRLTIEPALADFLVKQVVAEVNVPRGGSALLPVAVTRRGYSGPIQLTVPNLPPGLTVQGGHLPADGLAALMTLSASVQSPPLAGPVSLAIEGKGTNDGLAIVRRGEQAIVPARSANPGMSVLNVREFALGMSGPEPFVLQGPPAVIVVKGYPTMVPVTVTRALNQAAVAVEVTALVPQPAAVPGRPAGAATIAVQSATAAAGASATMVTLAPAVNALEGTLDVAIQGQAKVNNADRVVMGQALAVTVVKPFALELLTPSLPLPAGATAILKGRVQRQAVFKEAVQFKIAGLPPGVTLAAPVQPLPANVADFQIVLKVDPKAPAAVGSLTLTCSTTITGMAYSHPPLTVPVQVMGRK